MPRLAALPEASAESHGGSDAALCGPPAASARPPAASALAVATFGTIVRSVRGGDVRGSPVDATRALGSTRSAPVLPMIEHKLMAAVAAAPPEGELFSLPQPPSPPQPPPRSPQLPPPPPVYYPLVRPSVRFASEHGETTEARPSEDEPSVFLPRIPRSISSTELRRRQGKKTMRAAAGLARQATSCNLMQVTAAAKLLKDAPGRLKSTAGPSAARPGAGGSAVCAGSRLTANDALQLLEKVAWLRHMKGWELLDDSVALTDSAKARVARRVQERISAAAGGATRARRAARSHSSAQANALGLLASGAARVLLQPTIR